MVAQKYRWDFIGLSSQVKPIPATSNKVVDGSTFFECDTSKLYVYCKDNWYERKPLGGGGSGGTDDFEQLTNRPKYNGVTMTGDTNIPEVISYSDFTGATSETAGSNGLVPAPTTSDTGKFLKGDGTWGEVSSYSLPIASDSELGGIKVGSNLSINSSTGVLDATDTTYSAFTGTDGTTAGNAGLVPAPATTDAGKFLKADGTWDTAGSSINIVQTPGTSTTDVMSQNAVTSMVFADPSTRSLVRIGSGSTSTTGVQAMAIGHNTVASGTASTAVGRLASATSAQAIAIGNNAKANHDNSIAFSGATTTVKGEFAIAQGSNGGYNNSKYRLLTGLYDGQSDHDAATVGQLKMGTLSTTPTGTTVGFPGRLYSYDSGGGTYEVWLCVHDNGDNTYVWKQVNLT